MDTEVAGDIAVWNERWATHDIEELLDTPEPQIVKGTTIQSLLYHVHRTEMQAFLQMDVAQL